MDDGGLQRIVVEDRGVDEGGKLRLPTGDVLRLAADALPYRVDRVELAPGLMLGHAKTLVPLRGL